MDDFPFDDAPSVGEAAPALPENVDAEIALLAAALHEPASLDRCQWLKPDDFAYKAHADLWRIMQEMRTVGAAIDPITISARLKNDPDFAQAGGFKWLMELAAAILSTSNAADYAKAVREASTRRAAIRALQETIAKLHSSQDDSAAVIGQTMDALDALQSQDGAKTGLKQADHFTEERLHEIAQAHKGVQIGTPSGIQALDDLTGGFQGLTVMGARPSMGKTLVSVVAAANNTEAGRAVAFFSLEMSGAALMGRRLAAVTGIPVSEQTRPYVALRDYDRLVDGARKIEGQPLWIDDRGGLSVSQIIREARKLHRRHPLSLIVIDYLGLIDMSEVRSPNEASKIAYVTRSLAALSKQVPVLLLCQLNRAVESREDKRPTLADLRDSGAIEQDADAVIMLYRPGYYLQRESILKKPNEGEDAFAARQHAHAEALASEGDKLDLIVAKNRSGNIGTARVRVDLPKMRIEPLFEVGAA
jgi:replicative DNA helicase